MSDDELFAILSEIADEEIMAQNRASIIEVGRRIISLAANGAEPIYQVRMKGNLKWQDMEKISFDTFTDEERYARRIIYTAPVASGPRYDWSVSGMKQSDTGNWVMAGDAAVANSALMAAIKVVHDKMRHEDDCGPAGYGWQSDELSSAWAVIDAAMEPK